MYVPPPRGARTEKGILVHPKIKFSQACHSENPNACCPIWSM